jgi:hypothetical protein
MQMAGKVCNMKQHVIGVMSENPASIYIPTSDVMTCTSEWKLVIASRDVMALTGRGSSASNNSVIA